jgi:hypothetical protein
MEVLIIVGVIAAFILIAIFGSLAEKQRREQLAALALRLGLRFSPARDYSIPVRFVFLKRVAQGSNRYAFNVLAGESSGEQVLIYDYHYETTSTDSKGRRQKTSHYLSIYLILLPKSFPELTIAREQLFSKIAQAFGYDDIDFESHEFSKTFCVRSGDKRFAYDFCNTSMMEYLLANQDLSLEVERDTLAIGFNEKLTPGRLEVSYLRLREIRSRIPDYLF